MRYVQKTIGYVLIFELIDLFLPIQFAVICFLLVIFMIKIIPHPVNHRNPFAFGIRLRSEH